VASGHASKNHEQWLLPCAKGVYTLVATNQGVFLTTTLKVTASKVDGTLRSGRVWRFLSKPHPLLFPAMKLLWPLISESYGFLWITQGLPHEQA